MRRTRELRALMRPAAAGTLAATALVLCGTASATAAPAAPAVPHAYSAGQIAAARAAAGDGTTLGVLRRFFAHDPDPGTPAARPDRTAGAPRLTGAATTVFTLNADFVAGRAGAPVAEPAFVAAEAVSATGQRASVWSVRTAHGWQVVNIASGSDEPTYAARAHGHGTVFREPQVNAWYLLRGGRVLPLNTEARAAVGAHGTTLTGYRHHVRAAYGSRLTGSRYDRDGYAGGFGRASARAATKSAEVVAERTAAEQASRPSGADAGTLAGLGAAGAALALGVALAGRRLRDHGPR
ncbi:hypothetical protein AQJ66_19295 [Streptomyces bungoensis]|uniref:Uncharacterized protein n=1 Tax=Streptomyces bungoensis TaxID=285568 RepID=A0A101T072_9ACTN|nr:hypothetical protein [Streptomyces bungoensis]KUN83379.1 hypothetical protein AQJ66_19295 [Streptomyces bungoensis]